MEQAQQTLVLVMPPHPGSTDTWLGALSKLRVSVKDNCAEQVEIKGVWFWPEVNIDVLHSPIFFFLSVGVNKFIAIF